MKFYTIAMMVFLLSLSISIISQLDIMNVNMAYQADWISQVQSDSYKNQNYTSGLAPDQNSGSDIFSDFRIAITIFGMSLFYTTVGMPFMLSGFGLSMGLALLISLPIWLIYFMAIIQLLLRTGFEGMK